MKTATSTVSDNGNYVHSLYIAAEFKEFSQRNDIVKWDIFTSTILIFANIGFCLIRNLLGKVYYSYVPTNLSIFTDMYVCTHERIILLLDI